VLFLDAVNLPVDGLRQRWRTPVLDLGPGTLLTIGGVALAAHLLLHVGLVPSLLLGAVLASTDPIVLRDVLRNPGIPRSMRQLLTLEAGMNDIVVLPVVLVLIAVGQAQISGAAGWVGFLAQLLLLSPLLGLLVGGVGAWLMGQADARYSIRREYQALYGIGLVLAAYAGAQAVGADGFLAAFFGGLAVNLFDVTLCDCFLEYGEVTAEMAMLLTFLLFGAALSTLFGLIAFLPALALAVVVIVIVRVFLGWFGPRGLSSLLLALLVVEAGTPGAVRLFAVTGVVVLVSTIVHGVSATPGTAWYVRHVARALLTPAEERESTADGLFAHDQDAVPRLTPAELAMQLAGDQPPVVLDVRTRGQYDQDQGQIPNSVRVLPDQLRDWARTADRKRAVVAYCT
jgi:NhaP-type Na+/H+ or K+/H+ antiporter